MFVYLAMSHVQQSKYVDTPVHPPHVLYDPSESRNEKGLPVYTFLLNDFSLKRLKT